MHFDNQMVYAKFDPHIHQLAEISRTWIRYNSLNNYSGADSINLYKNLSIFKLLKDTIYFKGSEEKMYKKLPYAYDFDDFNGKQDLGYMFVTKLLATNKGNCHSLPYLYKILADELDATCWLAFAANHIYIKNRSQRVGWYNTELTSGTFPVDAWIATSGYVPTDAIRSGIYMDTLSNQQAIALCVLDLAKGYEFKTKNYLDGFILKCCDLTLQYHPVNIQAILLKAETLKRIYETSKDRSVYQQMEGLYVKLFELGYREMPDKMYMQWLRSVTEQRNKFGNKAVKNILN